MGGDHGGIFFLASEGAACFHLDDADAVGGQGEKLHEGFMDIVGTLKGAPNCEALLRIENGNHAVVFNVELLLRAGGIFGFDDVIGGAPGNINVALFDEIAFEEIVRAPDDLREAFAFFDVEDCGEWHVFDGDGFDCFRQEMAVRMSEEKNRFFWMIDAAVRETRLVVFDEGNAIGARNVAAGDDDEFVPIDSGIKVDALDFATRDAAANGRAEEHAGQGHVVDVAGLAGDFAAAFHAGDGGADDGMVFHLGRGIFQKIGAFSSWQ